MFWDYSGKQDVYLEIACRYERYIYDGLYKNGEKLPSVREVASELGVNPNTVAKAYSVLEERGLVKAIPKKGAFVIYRETGTNDSESFDGVDMRQLFKEMKNHGVLYEDIILMLKEVFGENDQD